MTRHIQWVTDVPTPYRIHLHERMAEVFPRHGLSFEVQFMAWTVPTRHWTFRPGELAFPHRLWSGAHPRIGDVDLHFNPGLLWDLARRPADLLVVGGYASISHFLAPWSSPGTLKVLYAESNPESSRRNSAPAMWIKRAAVRRYDAFLIPQQRTLDLLREIDPKASAKPVVVLPNLVDGEIWVDAVDAARPSRAAVRRELGVADDEQLWVCPARLSDDKGLDRFLPRLEGRKGLRMVIAGTGPQHDELSRLIERRRLPVRLLGQKTQSDLVNLYAAAELFVLPSMRDPSPLSPIEALAAQLPVLVSERIGNRAEVLGPDNGWSFDPMAASNGFLDAILATPRAELEARGRASRARFHHYFDSSTCVDRMAAGLRELYDRSGKRRR